MNVPLLDLKAQYAELRDEIEPILKEVCESQYFILGPRVLEFEAQIAEYCGVGHGIGASSGTDALLVALMALEVGPGDAVITTPYTFFATAGCVARTGATPVFADIDPQTYNVSPAAVAALLENWSETHPGLNPKVLMPVHLYGQMADMDPLCALAEQHGLAVIEDACQAIGAEYPSAVGTRKAGAMGRAGAFSFFPSKNLGGFGDGGMVVVNDDTLADRLRYLRNHGANPKYYHGMIGGNFRLDALQAVVLSVKLKRLEQWHAGRRENAALYDRLLADSVVATPEAVYADSGILNAHIYNQYIVRVPDRDRVRAAMNAAGIGCEVYYPVPLHLQECFADLGHSEGDFPVSEKAARETLALPIYPELTDEMQEYVAKTLVDAVGN